MNPLTSIVIARRSNVHIEGAIFSKASKISRAKPTSRAKTTPASVPGYDETFYRFGSVTLVAVNVR